MFKFLELFTTYKKFLFKWLCSVNFSWEIHQNYRETSSQIFYQLYLESASDGAYTMVATDLVRSDKKYRINSFDSLDAKTGNQNSSDEESSSLLQTTEDHETSPTENAPYKMQYVWKNIIAFVIMHIYSIYGLGYLFSQDSYKVIYIRK